MIAAEIPSSAIVAMIAVVLPLVVALFAWSIRELSRISNVLTKVEEKLDHEVERGKDHEARLRVLERA